MITEKISKYIPKNSDFKICGNTAEFKVATSDIKEIVKKLYIEDGFSLKLITASDERKQEGVFKIFYIFGIPKENIFLAPYIAVKAGEEFPSVALIVHEAWNYERKIRTFFGLEPVGNPDKRSIILHENWPSDVFPLRKDFQWNKHPKAVKGVFDFQKIEGDGIYEIPVGPIHAGIIEPGHFRFNVAGEEIFSLEPRLGFVHKGTEKLFETLPLSEKIRLSEKISGDSSFSHSLAFCQALESLAGVGISERAKYLRVIFSELERLANHFGDAGAIMLDAGFNFGGANGARIREMVMQLNEKYGGNRFLRNINTIGGVLKDINTEEGEELISALENILEDFEEVVKISMTNSGLLNRLQGTGILTYEIAKSHGAMGVAAKAVGFPKDARADYPYAGYKNISIEVAQEKSGDVMARFNIRVKEVRESVKIIKIAVDKLQNEENKNIPQGINLKPNTLAVSVVEGWRGDIAYFVKTDQDGNVARVDVRDPSFLNWACVEHAGPGNIVPDFPLINKSFNLSYSGNDL